MGAKIKIAIFFIFAFLFSFGYAFASVILSDQGTDVHNSTGTNLALGNLTILVFDASSSGTTVFNQTFSDAIVNGSWNVMIRPNLEFGKSYWKDYEINGENLNFSSSDRLEFQSPLGLINNVSYINFSLIDSCSANNAIRKIYENGSIVCESIGSAGNSSFNQTLTDSLYAPLSLTGDNSSWNQSLAGTLYSPITWNYNQTTAAINYILSNPYNWLNTSFNSTYAAWAYNQTTGANTYTDYIVSLYNVSWLSTYNATYAANIGNSSWNETRANNLYAPLSLTGDNSSWNQSLAGTLYSPITWNYNQTTAAINYILSNPYNWLNTTTGTNATIINAANITAGRFGTGSYNISNNLTFETTNDGINMGNASIYWNGSSLIIKVT